MSIDAIVLFSGGLDSILAAKVLEAQGLNVLCAHFTSPFFGDARASGYWRKCYGLEIECLDVGEQFSAMLASRPPHGFGKVLNPCVDCKILLLREAKKLLEKRGAKFLASGEVLGQRPMSQRRDTLFLISREADVRDILLRPLSALHLPPTPMEETGFVRRGELLGISGRGRQEQLELAKKFGLDPIPTPAGGCRLTEKENARRYWQIMRHFATGSDCCADFSLAAMGRQLWQRGCQLCIGRNAQDNEELRAHARANDILLKLRDFSGPLALCRNGAEWPEDMLRAAAARMASHAPKAAASGAEVSVSAKLGDTYRVFSVRPDRGQWDVPGWEETKAEIRAWMAGEQRPLI